MVTKGGLQFTFLSLLPKEEPSGATSPTRQDPQFIPLPYWKHDVCGGRHGAESNPSPSSPRTYGTALGTRIPPEHRRIKRGAASMAAPFRGFLDVAVGVLC